MATARAPRYHPAARRPGGPRQWLAALLVAVGTALLIVSLPLDHVHRNVLDEQRFDRHAAALLREPAVRDTLVTQITADITRGSGGTASPVHGPVEAVTRRVVTSPAFARAWRRVARTARRQILDPDRRTIDVAIPNVATLAEQAAGPLPPEVLALLQRSDTLSLVSFTRDRDAARTIDRAHDLADRGTIGLALAVAAFLIALLLARRRRTIFVGIGAGLIVAGALLLIAELAIRSTVLDGVTDPAGHRVAAAAWDELLDGFRAETAILLAAGIALSGLALALGRGRGR